MALNLSTRSFPFPQLEKNIISFKGLFGILNTTTFEESLANEQFAKSFNVFTEDIISETINFAATSTKLGFDRSRIWGCISIDQGIPTTSSPTFGPAGQASGTSGAPLNPNVEKIIIPLTKVSSTNDQLYVAFVPTVNDTDDYDIIASSNENYQTELNPSSGKNVVYEINREQLATKQDQILTNFVNPNKFGQAYKVKIYESLASPGAQTDIGSTTVSQNPTNNAGKRHGGWIFDYKSGTLLFSTQTLTDTLGGTLQEQPDLSDLNHPLWLEAYRYKGQLGLTGGITEITDTTVTNLDFNTTTQVLTLGNQSVNFGSIGTSFEQITFEKDFAKEAIQMESTIAILHDADADGYPYTTSSYESWILLNTIHLTDPNKTDYRTPESEKSIIPEEFWDGSPQIMFPYGYAIGFSSSLNNPTGSVFPKKFNPVPIFANNGSGATIDKFEIVDKKPFQHGYKWSYVTSSNGNKFIYDPSGKNKETIANELRDFINVSCSDHLIASVDTTSSAQLGNNIPILKVKQIFEGMPSWYYTNMSGGLSDALNVFEGHTSDFRNYAGSFLTSSRGNNQTGFGASLYPLRFSGSNTPQNGKDYKKTPGEEWLDPDRKLFFRTNITLESDENVPWDENKNFLIQYTPQTGSVLDGNQTLEFQKSLFHLDERLNTGSFNQFNTSENGISGNFVNQFTGDWPDGLFNMYPEYDEFHTPASLINMLTQGAKEPSEGGFINFRAGARSIHPKGIRSDQANQFLETAGFNSGIFTYAMGELTVPIIIPFYGKRTPISIPIEPDRAFGQGSNVTLDNGKEGMRNPSRRSIIKKYQLAMLANGFDGFGFGLKSFTPNNDHAVLEINSLESSLGFIYDTETIFFSLKETDGTLSRSTLKKIHDEYRSNNKPEELVEHLKTVYPFLFKEEFRSNKVYPENLMTSGDDFNAWTGSLDFNEFSETLEAKPSYVDRNNKKIYTITTFPSFGHPNSFNPNSGWQKAPLINNTIIGVAKLQGALGVRLKGVTGSLGDLALNAASFNRFYTSSFVIEGEGNEAALIEKTPGHYNQTLTSIRVSQPSLAVGEVDIITDNAPALGGDLLLNSKTIKGFGTIDINGNIEATKITATSVLSSSGDLHVGGTIDAASFDLTAFTLEDVANLNTNSHVTASGNISASGYIIGNNITSSNNVSASGYVIANSITSSNNISASGLIIASASHAPTHTDSILAVVYDTSSGQFHYTGSYGAGGGGVGVGFPFEGDAVITGSLQISSSSPFLQLDSSSNNLGAGKLHNRGGDLFWGNTNVASVGSGITAVSQDSSPSLGGNLTLGNNDITGTDGASITLTNTLETNTLTLSSSGITLVGNITQQGATSVTTLTNTTVNGTFTSTNITASIISSSDKIITNKVTASLYALNNPTQGDITVIAPGSDPNDIILGSTPHQLDLRGEKIIIAGLANSGDVEIGRTDNKTKILSSITASNIPQTNELPFYLGVSSSGEIIKINQSDVTQGGMSVDSSVITGLTQGENIIITGTSTDEELLVSFKVDVSQSAHPNSHAPGGNVMVGVRSNINTSSLPDDTLVRVKLVNGESYKLKVSRSFTGYDANPGDQYEFDAIEFYSSSHDPDLLDDLPSYSPGFVNNFIYKIVNTITNATVALNPTLNITNITASGDISASGNFIGNLTGTASFADSSSVAISSSYALSSSNALTSSYAITSSLATNIDLNNIFPLVDNTPLSTPSTLLSINNQTDNTYITSSKTTSTSEHSYLLFNGIDETTTGGTFKTQFNVDNSTFHIDFDVEGYLGSKYFVTRAFINYPLPTGRHKSVQISGSNDALNWIGIAKEPTTEGQNNHDFSFSNSNPYRWYRASFTRDEVEFGTVFEYLYINEIKYYGFAQEFTNKFTGNLVGTSSYATNASTASHAINVKNTIWHKNSNNITASYDNIEITGSLLTKGRALISELPSIPDVTTNFKPTLTVDNQILLYNTASSTSYRGIEFLTTGSNKSNTSGRIIFSNGDTQKEGFSINYNGGSVNDILDLSANTFTIHNHKDGTDTRILEISDNNKIGLLTNPSNDFDVSIGSNNSTIIDNKLKVGSNLTVNASTFNAPLTVGGITEQSQDKILTYNSTTGEIHYTSSNAFGFGGGSGETADNDWEIEATQLTASLDVAISGSLNVLTDITASSLSVRPGGISLINFEYSSSQIDNGEILDFFPMLTFGGGSAFIGRADNLNSSTGIPKQGIQLTPSSDDYFLKMGNIGVDAKNYITIYDSSDSIQRINYTSTTHSFIDTDSNELFALLKKDTINFITNVTSSGNVSASGYITANNITSSNNIIANGNISADGNISASGDLFGDELRLTGGKLYEDGTNRLTLGATNTFNGNLIISGSGANLTLFNTSTTFNKDTVLGNILFGNNDNGNPFNAYISVVATEAYNPDIKGGAKFVFRASKKNQNIGTSQMLILDPDDGAQFTTNITASGNISSSGTIVANKIEADRLISHAGDPNTGLQFASDTVVIEANNENVASFSSTKISFTETLNMGSAGNGKRFNLWSDTLTNYAHWSSEYHALIFQDHTYLSFGNQTGPGRGKMNFYHNGSRLVLEDYIGDNILHISSSDTAQLIVDGHITASGNILLTGENDNEPTLRIEQYNNTESNAGPSIEIYRHGDSANSFGGVGPDGLDIGSIKFIADDYYRLSSFPNQIIYSEIQSLMRENSYGFESGILDFKIQPDTPNFQWPLVTAMRILDESGVGSPTVEISGSLKISGSINSDITASNNISASGDIFAKELFVKDNFILGGFQNDNDHFLNVRSKGGFDNHYSGIKLKHATEGYGFTIQSQDGIDNLHGLNILRHAANQVGGESALFIERINGNIGIGTTTPSAKLDVNSSFKAQYINTPNTVSGSHIEAAYDVTANRYIKAGKEIRVYTNLDSNLIGAGSIILDPSEITSGYPSYIQADDIGLKIYHQAQIARTIQLGAFGDGSTAQNRTGSLTITQDGEIKFPYLNPDVGNSDARYNTTTGELTYDSSTRKTKKNITPASNSIYEDVLNLNPSTFNRKNPKSPNLELGLIAEEAASANPLFAWYGENYVHDESGSIHTVSGSRILEDDSVVPVNVNWNAVVTALVGKIKDLEQRISDLEE